MNRKFLRWQLREWMPFLLVIAFLSLIIAVTASLTTRLDYLHDYYTGKDNLPSVNYLLSIILPSAISASIMPLFVFDYRYKKSKSDTYLQLPLKEKELRNTRLTIGIVYLLVIYTISFWLSTLIIFLRQDTLARQVQGPYFNYGYFALFYVYFFLAIIYIYFSNAFLANLAFNLLDAVIYILAGLMILSLLPNALYSLFARLFLRDSTEVADFSRTFLYGWANLNFSTIGICDEVFSLSVPGMTDEVIFSSTFSYVQLAFMIIGFGLGIFAALYLYLSRETSGEHSGSIDLRYRWVEYIPHIFYFTLARFLPEIFSSTKGGWIVLISAIYIGIYYLSICAMRRTFKPHYKHYIIMACVTAYEVFCFYLFQFMA